VKRFVRHCVFAFLTAMVAMAPALAPQQASAVVYCKAVGVPKGCVAAPSAAAVRCTRPGYPVGCFAGAGAPGVGVTRGVGVGAPGVGVQPMNRGGPVNRIGVR